MPERKVFGQIFSPAHENINEAYLCGALFTVRYLARRPGVRIKMDRSFPEKGGISAVAGEQIYLWKDHQGGSGAFF